MSKLLVLNNTLKGAFKPPRYKMWGLEDGIPFTRVFRTLDAVKKLGNKPNVESVVYEVLQ